MRSVILLKENKLIKTAFGWYKGRKTEIIRYSIIAILFLACMLIVPRIATGNRNFTFLYIGLLTVTGLVLVLKWPILGIFAFLLGGMFVPISFQGGFNVTQIGIFAMLGLWFFDMVIIKREIKIVKSRTIFPIIAFIAISIISFCFGQFSWYPFARNAPIEAQMGGLAINLLSAGGFLLVAHFVNDLKKLQIFTWAFILLSFLYVFGRAIHLGLADAIFTSGYTRGSLFWIWLAAMIAGQFFGNKGIQAKQRIVLGVMLLILFYVAFVQAYDWKSGWFPPLVSVASIFTIKYWKKVRYFAILAIIPFYLLVTTSIGAEDWSWGTRLDAWLIILSIAQVSPVLGMGFANYYWYTPLFPIRGYFVKFNSHSQIVDLIAQTGILGLVCFFWFFGEASLLGLRLLKKVPEGFSMGYVYGVLGGIAGTMVAAYLVDWVLPFVYNIGMNGFRASILAWLFIGGIVSIEQLVRNDV